MHVKLTGGIALDVDPGHVVFAPLGPYGDGDEVDPLTVDVHPVRAGDLRPGQKIVVRNLVQTVLAVF